MLERPEALFILVLLPLFWFVGYRRWQVTGPVKAWSSAIARTLLVLLLVASIAQPRIVDTSGGLTLMVVADVSRSIPQAQRIEADEFLQKVAKSRLLEEDRLGLVAVARHADTLAMPAQDAVLSTAVAAGDFDGTDISAGIKRALALLPPDTASRILLVSDGNETMGNAMEAADLARANGIPIDVLPLQYTHEREVVFEGLRAPARARVGQSVDLKLFLRSQGAASGVILLWRNDKPVDLDPDGAGVGLRVELPPGASTLTIPVSVEAAGAHRFRAIFEPTDGDSMLENNVAAGTIFASGEGRILVIDDTGDESSSFVQALQQGHIAVDVVTSEQLSAGADFLASYDAIVLANIPRFAIDNETDRILHSFVHDLGGGLLMLGGDHSFGAGGWIDSQTAKALPVKLDPPQTRELPRGSLILVVHSCEMAQGNYWGQEVAVSAIDALSRLDYVGIITFGFGRGDGNFGASWAFPLQLAGDKSAAKSAAKGMQVGDMPDFQPTLELSLKGLDSVRAGQKHVIIISDGDPAPPSQKLLDEFKSRKVTVTTVMVAGHGTAEDNNNMRAVAEQTGGNFYNVVNPKHLPKIFVKEATLVSRSLIIEGEFVPRFTSGLPGPVDGFSGVPPVSGYVLTVPREGLAQIPISIPNADGVDPLFAYWNYGLGKSAAFTSDLSGRWGGAWVKWASFQSFWERVIRWLARPATPRDVIMSTRLDGDRGIVELEAVSGEGGFSNFLRTNAVVLGPDGYPVPLQLEQIGPGRYRGEFAASEAGAYLVNVGFTGTDGAAAGSVQSSLNVAYQREFRATRDNAALMHAIAERTGGRVLRVADAGTYDAFDRRGLVMPESARRIWDLLAIIAAALLVIDVAIRRLAFDTAAAREMAERALGASAPGTAGGIEAWKRARSAAPSGDESRAKSQGARSSAAAVESSIKPVSGRIVAEPPSVVKSESEGEPTSAIDRLRAAKERARREAEERGNPDADGGGN